MKQFLLSGIALCLSFGLYAQMPCPGEKLVSLGDDNSLSHTYYDPSTNTVFGVGYFKDSVALLDYKYYANPGITGKYIVQMDTAGYVMSSFQVNQGINYLEFPGGNGYFEPGIGFAGTNSLIVPSTYQDQGGNYVFEVQAWDKGQQGLTLWTQLFIGTTTVGENYGFDMIKIAPSGDIILSGVYGDSLTTVQQQVSTVFTAGATSTGFVMILDGNSGALKSMTHVTGSNRMELFGLTTDDAGNIYVSGNAFNTTAITVGGKATTYTGNNSAFLFKLDAAGQHQWTHMFESSYEAGPEPKAIQYDRANDYIHYVCTDYEKGSKLGALNARDGSIAWERTMVVPNWHYISYSSWIDDTNNAIFYSVWGKGLGQPEASLIIDGKLVKDGINTYTYFHKFSLDGISQYVSPSPFTSIGDIAIVSPKKILIQANYQRSKNLQNNMLGIFDPANYPAPFLYVQKDGVYLGEGLVTLTASSDVPGVTYQWMINGDPLAGEIKASFTPTSAGDYNVEINDGMNCPVRSRLYRIESQPTLEIDSLALVDLYNSTKGTDWFNSTNWLVGNVNTWNGVTVTGGRVTALRLESNNLNGQFPGSLDRLTGLQDLHLGYNSLTGAIPSSFWSLKNLVNIFLHENQNLYWELHPNIENLTSLRNITAYNTKLSGTIPTEIGNVSSLNELWVSNCDLTGGLPPEVGNLPALTTLDLSNNPLGGIIPVEVGNLTTLEYFQMGGCGLTGSIPDELWQLPNLVELSAQNNPKLSVNLPANLETLTQLERLVLAHTIPMATAFPEDFYSLVNLIDLDLGGHRFTGSLDSRVSNWKKMEYLWLWSNDLGGAIPAEMASVPLKGASFSDNRFTSMPDLDLSDTTMYQLEVELNLFDFDDIARNMGSLEIYRYSPQKKRPTVYTTVDEGGTVDLINSYTASGNQYQWTLNNSDPISTNMNHTITGASLEDLGRYFCRVTNPAVPEMTIESEFHDVAFSGPPRSFTVDNSPESLADFRSFFAASYGTNAGDTLYVAGSATPYSMHFIIFETPRVLYGPGYFLAENPETQASTETAQISSIGFMQGAEGSEVYGLDIRQAILNNQASYLNNTLMNIRFTGNSIHEFSINDDCQNIYVNKNYINKFTLASTSLVGFSRSYQDISVENNIIDTVTTVFAKATAEKNDMVNVRFDRNTIKIFTDSIHDATVSNNIINNYQALGNTDTNNHGFAIAVFENNSGVLNIDNDYIPTNISIDAGAFSGTNPYVLSGIPEAPHLFELTNTGRIRINARGKTATDANITSLGYRLGQRGVLVDEGKVSRLEPGNAIDVLFRPRLGKVTPGGAYDLMLWARDDQGRKSIHQTITFTAETTTATGQVYSSNDLPVTKGEVMLFEINQEGTAFDTLVTSLNNEGAFSFNNIVIGDYLAMGKADTTAFAEQLPTYYERIDLWEEADTLLLEGLKTEFNIKLIAKPKPVEGEGEISGFIEEEYEVADETTGRVMKLERKRVSGAGVSVRRAVRTSRASEEVYVLIAYLYSDEHGRFDFSSLPPDNYRLNIQYPGYPMNPSSDIDITIGNGSSDNYSVEALVAKGEISVSTTSITGFMDEIIQSVRVYPNPTSAEGVTVEFLKDMDLKGEVNLQLFDIKGNLASSKTVMADDLKNNNEVRLSLDGLKKGTYMIKLFQANQVLTTVRLVVQ